MKKPLALIFCAAIATLALFAAPGQTDRASPQGGTITRVTAGSGLTGGATGGPANLDVGAGSGIVVDADHVAVDPTYTQRRVSGSCTAPDSIRVIAQDGTVTCTSGTGDITGVTAGPGLSGGGTSGAVTLNLSMAPLTCSAGQHLDSASATGAFTCSADSGGAPSGTGLVRVTSGAYNTRAELSGDVTTAGALATTIASNAVTYAKMQDVSATSRFIGRITAGAGDPEELTGTQATTLLDAFTSSLKGLAPASGGGTTNFLRADGTWAAPAGGVSGSGTSGTGTRWTGTNAIGNASFTDTGSAMTVGNFTWAVISPTMGGGSFVDFAPTGLGTASLIRAATTTSTCTLDTLTGGAAGRIVWIQNVGSQSLSVLNQTTATGTAANKIITGTGASIPVAVDQTIGIVYDGTTSRWRVFASPASGTGTVTNVASGTGLTGGPITTTGTLSLSIAGASCSTNQVMTALGSTGTGTCAAPPAFSSSTNGYATASGGGTTNFQRADGAWAAPPGTTYSAGTGLSLSTTTFSANLAGASCSAGNHVSALSATGTGTCTADSGLQVAQAVTISGTNNDYAGVNATTTQLRVTPSGTSRITGITGGADTRTVTIYNVGGNNLEFSYEDASSTAANRLTTTVGYTNIQAVAPTCSTQFTYNGATSRWVQDYMSCFHLPGLVVDQILYANDANGVAFLDATNATADGWISKVGAANGTAQYRNTHIGNGKGVEVVAAMGADSSLRVNSSNVYSVNSTPATNKPGTPTSCGTSPSILMGGNFGFRLQVGTGTATSCTVAFANGGFLDTPECNVNVQTGTAPVWMPYISALSATSITVTANATGNMAGTILHVQCTGASINPASP